MSTHSPPSDVSCHDGAKVGVANNGYEQLGLNRRQHAMVVTGGVHPIEQRQEEAA